MPGVVEFSAVDGAVLLGLRVVALATFSLAMAVLAGIAVWLVCCGIEARRGPAGGGSVEGRRMSSGRKPVS
jgi:hypothetical protein